MEESVTEKKQPVFSEVICYCNNEFQHLSYHQERVDRTVATFQLPPIQLSRLLACSESRLGRFKCRVVYSFAAPTVSLLPYTLPHIEGAALIDGGNIDYSFKYADRSELNHLKALAGEREPVIVIDGELTDSSFCNLVFESREGLFTPSRCLLAGTRRQILLDRGEIAERRIGVDDLAAYDRVYFINAMIGIEDSVSVAVPDIRSLL